MPFKKGKSGNPAGRKAKTMGEREVEALARTHAPEAIERLRFWMASDNAKASVSAATTMLNRAVGSPKQATTHSGPDGGAIPHVITWKPAE